MLRYLLSAFTFIALTTPLYSNAQLEAVCPTTQLITNRKEIGAIIQYKNNQVQRSGGVGSQLTGFLKQPTIIATQGKNPFKLSRATIYNANGKKICSSSGRLGCASTRGECLARYKFQCNTTTARKATSKGGAFIKVANDLCIQVPNAGKCYNVKVRDLCDGRTL